MGLRQKAKKTVEEDLEEIESFTEAEETERPRR